MAHPNGRFDDWISYADYPVRALREGVSAEVLFRLTIAIDGTPTACETFGKSGSEELDHTTCKVLLKRAHFFPALNDQGKPIASIYSSALHWRAPVIFQAIPPTTTWKLTYDVTQDGIVANCHLETHGYPPTQQAYVNAGASCAGVGLFVPQVDAAGKPAPKHVVIVRTVTVTDAP